MNKSPDQAYWRSLEDLGDKPEFRQFLEGEFPSEAEVPTDALSRRRFLQIMGASVAMAGVAGCRWPEEKIVPFTSRPDGVDPGLPQGFATAVELGGEVRPLVVSSYDGRPVKVEGNPDHPLSFGTTDHYAQAMVLGMYDPDRSRNPVERHGGSAHKRSWADFETWAAGHFGALKAAGGAGLAFLVERSTSPTREALRARLRETYPDAGWYEWEPVSRDNERAGAALAFGHAVATNYRLDGAKVIACFDADLFQDHPTALRNARDFAAGRRADDGRMNRLYVAEAGYSITGGMADHRFPMASSSVGHALLQLAAELTGHQHVDLPGDFGGLKDALHADGHAPEWVAALAADLAHHKGESVIAVGSRQPDWVHALAHLLNRALGNTGRTVVHAELPDANRPHHGAAMGFLADAVGRNRVKTLVVLGGNPVFDAPADLGFADLLGKVDHTVHLSEYDDETSRACTWHLPRAHAFESWSDVVDAEGRYSVTQPLIRPLYDGRTPIEILGLLVDDAHTAGHDLVKATADAQLPAVGRDVAWQKLLQAGVLDGSGWAEVTPRLEGRGIVAGVRRGAAAHAPELGASNFEVVFQSDPSLYDGRFANNGWLQELPDFMTKLTWDNAAILGFSTAEALGVKHGDMVSLGLDGRSLDMAVYVQPGQAPWTCVVQLGHGRTAAGRVGDGTGFDGYRLRGAAALDFTDGLTVAAAGGTYPLATTQDHFAIDATGRNEREKRSHTLIVEGTWDEYQHHPDFVHHRHHLPPLKSLWEERTYEGHAWGMSIDLNTCTGCNACLVACQAENNIPVVGKDQVGRGREMSWLRLDRYFQGEPDEAKVAQQPVACVHCEMAPCEQVCPVGATMHSEEGLNEMVYNRCVGTRYCANNCPYKVRRFNFFNLNKDIPDVQKMVYNPEVSLRARGVMEKCSYCVQRIEAAKITAKNEGRAVRDGEVTTACQQTCPTSAIVFGDLNDEGSEVARLEAGERSYHMLAELNIKPRTSYMARLRNPNPELAESSDGHSAH